MSLLESMSCEYVASSLATGTSASFSKNIAVSQGECSRWQREDHARAAHCEAGERCCPNLTPPWPSSGSGVSPHSSPALAACTRY